MEEKKPIPYTQGMELVQGEKYISECGIVFTYTTVNNPDKPYVLNNGIGLNHIPTTSDIGVNNLKPLNGRTKEEQRQICSKAGIISGISRKRKRTFQESMQWALSLKATRQDIASLSEETLASLTPEEIQVLDQQDIITLKAVEMAKQGSDKFAIYSRDTAGDKPTDNINMEADITTEADRELMRKISERLQTSM